MNADCLLLNMFGAAIEAAAPANCLPSFLPTPPKGRTIVVGAGKAAAAMAAVFEEHWSGDFEGIVVTRYGHGAPTRKVRVVEAGHPMPDDNGIAAAEAILALVSEAQADDLVICLVSGGGSSLLSLPVPGISIDDKREVNRALLKSGATIAEMNCVRKQLSAIKGGKLALAAAPARVVSLVISDVPGDDLSVIASGPTVFDTGTKADARAILERYRIDAPASVAKHLSRPEPERRHTFAHPENVSNVLVATPQGSLEAAAAVADAAGYRPFILGNAIEGEARECATVHAGIVKQVVGYDQPISAPCAIISGGETTVTVRGQGRGGRNSEFLLSLAIALKGEKNVHAFAGDTDGIDGVENNAGAIIRPDSLERASASGLNVEAHLADNDAYRVFDVLGDLVVTGPTRTNVNDFRVILIDK